MTEHTGAMTTPDDSILVKLSSGSVSIDSAALERMTPEARDQLLAALNQPGAQAVLNAPSLAAYSLAVTPCHRCGAPATTQWPRQATEAEAAQHWDALEQNIRSQPDIAGHGNATWTADRSDTVTKAVHACDQHVVDAPHLTHDADCGGHGACGCGASDE